MLVSNGSFEKFLRLRIPAAAISVFSEGDQRWNVVRIAPQRFFEVDGRIVHGIAILIQMNALKIQLLNGLQRVRMWKQLNGLWVVQLVIFLLSILE